MNTAAIVHVPLGERSYSIQVGSGLLGAPASYQTLPRGSGAVIVTNETVGALYAKRLGVALKDIYSKLDIVLVDDGEAFKTWQTLQKILDGLVTAQADRSTTVIALGGGVVGDLAGFAAACYMRGVGYVQVPTTLLAQVDSSVGGKTAIDSSHGKNLIGAFHQPVLVLADTALLDTLPPRQFRAGYAEVAKYGLIGDAAFFAWLEANWRDMFAGGPAREHAIAVSCRMKAAIVSRDERETGERALLNLGHTFGHALEAAAGFSDRLLHGEAISVGMALAFRFSVLRGLMPATEAERVERHLAAVGLPTDIRSVPGGAPGSDRLMDLIAQDKKVKRGRLTFILARGIGASFIAPDIDAADVRAFLAQQLAE
jgi:3-dehydroquinate synthase